VSGQGGTIDDRGHWTFSILDAIVRMAPAPLEVHHVAPLADRVAAVMSDHLGLPLDRSGTFAPDVFTEESPATRVMVWLPNRAVTFCVSFAEQRVQRTEVHGWTMTPDLPWGWYGHGETPYVRRHVLPDQLSPASLALDRDAPRIGDVSLAASAAFVSDVLASTERMMQTIPCPWPIGGMDLMSVTERGVTRLETREAIDVGRPRPGPRPRFIFSSDGTVRAAT
jgi:hypothetical protein